MTDVSVSNIFRQLFFSKPQSNNDNNVKVQTQKIDVSQIAKEVTSMITTNIGVNSTIEESIVSFLDESKRNNTIKLILVPVPDIPCTCSSNDNGGFTMTMNACSAHPNGPPAQEIQLKKTGNICSF